MEKKTHSLHIHIHIFLEAALGWADAAVGAVDAAAVVISGDCGDGDGGDRDGCLLHLGGLGLGRVGGGGGL